MDFTALLWAQFAYAIWQYLRVAKFCRVPYGILNSFLACLYFLFKNKSKIVLPFQKVKYIVVTDPGIPYYIQTSRTSNLDRFGVQTNADNNQLQALREGSKFEYSRVDSMLPGGLHDYYKNALALSKCKLTLNGEDYSFLLKGKSDNFVYNICRDLPVLFCTKSDMLIPGWSIVEPMDQVDALNKIICEGYTPSIVRDERVLTIWFASDELNRNFTRLLSTLPLVAQAKHKRYLSAYIFFAIVSVDQMGVLWERVLRLVKDGLFHVYKTFISKVISSPKVRINICEFFSTFGEGFKFCDKYCHNFVRIKKGGKFLVCNSKACQLEGEMGEYISHCVPNGTQIQDDEFDIDKDLKLENGRRMSFPSSEWERYSIGRSQLYIEKLEGIQNTSIVVFCDYICVHSGTIDNRYKFYMLNMLREVADIHHLPISIVRENRAHCVNINDFTSDPLHYFSVQVFRAKKNIWVGDKTVI